MIVYRFENSDGVGPYQASTIPDKMYNAHCRNLHTHPGWYADGFNVCRKENFLAGCASIIQLKEWFKGFLRMLYKHGFFIVQYKVRSSAVTYGRSGKQLVFDKLQATRLS